jgi:hypothetical protein
VQCKFSVSGTGAPEITHVEKMVLHCHKTRAFCYQHPTKENISSIQQGVFIFED